MKLKDLVGPYQGRLSGEWTLDIEGVIRSCKEEELPLDPFIWIQWSGVNNDIVKRINPLMVPFLQRFGGVQIRSLSYSDMITAVANFYDISYWDLDDIRLGICGYPILRRGHEIGQMLYERLVEEKLILPWR